MTAKAVKQLLAHFEIGNQPLGHLAFRVCHTVEVSLQPIEALAAGGGPALGELELLEIVAQLVLFLDRWLSDANPY
jgi:hypothetical protein